MTAPKSKGESREGEGRSRKATTGDIALHIRERMKSEDRVPESITVRRVTDQVYMCRVFVVGEIEPEGFFISFREDGGA